jgi:outer membrane immunogenic protein
MTPPSMMRLYAAAGLTFAAATLPALAADVAPRLPTPRAAVYVPYFTWSGPYVGINAGYGFGNSVWTATTGATSGSFNTNGAQFGATAGYNALLGSFVFGIEGDVDWSGIKGTSAAAACAPTCTTANNWMGTVRGRIGPALDRFLPFVSAGAAVGNVKLTDGITSASATKIGWAVGAGIEYAFITNWSAKVEYLYVNLGSVTCDATCSGSVPFDTSFRASLLRVGLNYKF